MNVMKNIAIVTECRRFVFNYGETLQAVALNKAVSNMGYNAFTISYEHQKDNFRWWFIPHWRQYYLRALKFEMFRQENCSNTIFRSDDKSSIEQFLSNMDAVVCGSDCIWYEKCYNSILFLNFPRLHIPKIAYAPSLRDSVSYDKGYQRKVARWGRDFDYISTREIAGSKIVADLCKRKVVTVLDPTFLIERAEWDKMSAKRIIKEPYIFIYALGRTTPLGSIVKQISEHYRINRIVWIKMENNDGYCIGNAVLHVGPSEFISLIKYSAAVITDSFHGSVFSIIYNKPLYAIKRIIDEKDVYDNDARIKNIFEIMGINNYFSAEDDIDFAHCRIDYEQVNKKMTMEKLYSYAFLKDALDASTAKEKTL